MSRVDLTVVVCAGPSPRLLGDALRSLVAQRTNADWDVLVLGDAEDPATDRAVREARQALAVPVRLLGADARHGADACDRALDAVDAEVVAFLDEASQCLPGWVEHHHRAHRDPTVAACAGRTYPLLPVGAPAWVRAVALESGGPTGRYDLGLEEGVVVGGERAPPPSLVNVSLRTQVACAARRAAPPPASVPFALPGGDAGILVRLLGGGHRILYRPGAVVLRTLRPEELTLERVGGWSRAEGAATVLQEPPRGLRRLRVALRALRARGRHARRMRRLDSASSAWLQSFRRRAFHDGRWQACRGRVGPRSP